MKISGECKYRGCKGYIITNNDGLVNEHTALHSCNSNQTKNESLIVKNIIIKRCRVSNESFASIFTSESSPLQHQTLPNPTSFSLLRDYTRRLRNLRDDYVRVDNDDVPLSLQYTLSGKNMQFDSGVQSNSRNIIFFR